MPFAVFVRITATHLAYVRFVLCEMLRSHLDGSSASAAPAYESFIAALGSMTPTLTNRNKGGAFWSPSVFRLYSGI